MFDVQKIQISDRAIKYDLLRDQQPIAYKDIVKLWAFDADFAIWFSDLLAESDMPAFRWETPCVTAQNIDRKFEFVLVDASSFARRPTDCHTFSKFFTKEPVVSFPSLGRDAQMIVPTPLIDQDIYGHLAAFLRSAPDDQRVALWQMVGREFPRLIGDRPRWLSTAGGGVAWLHVRIDSRPKYYHYDPYRNEAYDK